MKKAVIRDYANLVVIMVDGEEFKRIDKDQKGWNLKVNAISDTLNFEGYEVKSERFPKTII